MNNTSIFEYTQLQYAIFRALCKTAGTQINQRALAKRTGVTPAAVSRALPQLIKDKLITIQEHGEMNLKEIELNRENRRTIELKRVENLRELCLCGVVDLIAERYAGSTIVLFGSYGRGEDTTRSDIDIAILGANEKKTDLAEYERQLERPIRIMHVKSLNTLSKEFKESIINGIVLVGGLTP